MGRLIVIYVESGRVTCGALLLLLSASYPCMLFIHPLCFVFRFDLQFASSRAYIHLQSS